MDWRDKRYTIRLSVDDEDIYNYLEDSSTESKNELIKSLLKQAIKELSGEGEDPFLKKLTMIQKQQKIYHEEIMAKLNGGLVAKVEETEEKIIADSDKEITQAIETSIDSMLSGFGD